MKLILEDAIKSHYDRGDYTEVVRDGLLCLMTEIRKKTDLKDIDGVELINAAFSPKNPKLRINNYQTSTEKNKHVGIMDISKGLVEYFRNPMSHEKQTYSKSVADAILTILDEVILEEIQKSPNLDDIEDWYLEITNELTPKTERYAKKMIQKITKNKRYDLLMTIFDRRNDDIELNFNVINELIKSLEDEAFTNFCNQINKSLLGNINIPEIIIVLKFIDKKIWKNLSDFSRTKIEEMVYEDATNIYIDSDCFDIVNGYLLENSQHILKNFENFDEIIKVIVSKIKSDMMLGHHLLNLYILCIIDKEAFFDFNVAQKIIKELNYKVKPSWYEDAKEILKKNKKSKWYLDLANYFELSLDECQDELPF